MPATDFRTLPELLSAAAAVYADLPALGSNVDGEWQRITYRELLDLCRRFACGLRASGVQTGQHVAIIAESCARWVICDFGIAMAGGVNVAMFPSLPPAQIEYILRDSGARLILVGSPELLKKVLVVRKAIPDLRPILMQGEPPPDIEVTTFDRVLASGEADRALASPAPDDLASIIYTSGTTGEQKGVMLTHDNFCSNVLQSRQILDFDSGDVFLSVLPLNHVFERTAGCYLPLSCGSCVNYVEHMRRLREYLAQIRPTYMMLVPRFLEALRDAILERAQKAPPLRRRLFHWALALGRRRLRYVLARRSVPPHLTVQYALAQLLVLDRIRRLTGLDRLKDFVTGAAALPIEINEFFQALGVEVMEGYGLTESSPVVSVNIPGQTTIGTVGPPLPGVEVKLGEHDEILIRGRNVMRGYYHKPEATAEAIDADGWLHTGDIGALRDGYLCITDRLKDLLVLSNGKNVAPQPIEIRLTTSPYLAQAVVLGDREAYVTALIVPNFEHLRAWAQTEGLQLPEAPEEAIRLEPVEKLLRQEIRGLTDHLADFEKVKDFRLLPQEFTIDSGELTPTLKVKRRVVVERYGALINDMYGR